ncbi:DUF1015 domain-containing protein [Spongiivirga citrea]|uniref:DUF1015 family protein n=1 Tax=Spongiivirga citrea TaxID=1481457 RepID=A0A6M0CNI2_9FLAO|nr:DUF1015 domain-containing protein [Spongiivirga citrea]NER17594.1 DUF1015 family protein [Spongiivirga citrea]
MAKIIPFKAVRAPKHKANLVPSRSYEDYDFRDLEAQLAYNPFSFLQIINPGYKFHKNVSGAERFQLVKNRYLEFKEDKTLIQDEQPCLYLYKIKTRNNSFCGIIAGTSSQDYKDDLIKKHEDTLEKREQLFTQYLKTVGFNAEPVLLTYPDNDQIATTLEKIMQLPAEYEFTTTDRVSHFLWVVNEENLISSIQSYFQDLGSVYIADGHHRSSSSNLLTDQLARENPEHTGKEPYNFFMSYLIPESDLKIYEFNRLVKDLNGLDKESFLMKLDKWFRIENRGAELYKPSKKHHFGMYLDGDFYSLYLRKSIYEFTDALSSLDTQILHKIVLEPILGITDLRNDKRIEYGYGKHNVIKMKNLIDEGEFSVGFSLIPVTIEEMKAIADAGLTMPPKSTYIEPKLRSGLTIYEF